MECPLPRNPLRSGEAPVQCTCRRLAMNAVCGRYGRPFNSNYSQSTNHCACGEAQLILRYLKGLSDCDGVPWMLVVSALTFARAHHEAAGGHHDHLRAIRAFQENLASVPMPIRRRSSLDLHSSARTSVPSTTVIAIRRRSWRLGWQRMSYPLH